MTITLSSFTSTDYLIAILFFGVAFAYSSVGHAGASGYIAVLLLFSLSPGIVRPSALMLNILVGLIGFVRFYNARLIDIKKVIPFLITSAPAAYYAGGISFHKETFNKLMAVILLFSAFTLLWKGKKSVQEVSKPIPWAVALVFGAGIGTLSGLTGTGGAIFLSPLLILNQWATSKEASGLAVVFVLVNSLTAFAGIYNSQAILPFALPLWALAVCLGGLAGTQLGIYRLSPLAIRRVLGLILISASVKMLVGS